MKLNRGQHRPLEISRGRADRDPRFVAMWYSGFGELTPPTPQCEMTQPQRSLALPPLAPDPDADKWRAAFEHAGAVHAMLQDEPDIDHAVLFETVRGLLDSNPTPDDIVSAYRARAQEKRNG